MDCTGTCEGGHQQSKPTEEKRQCAGSDDGHSDIRDRRVKTNRRDEFPGFRTLTFFDISQLDQAKNNPQKSAQKR